MLGLPLGYRQGGPLNCRETYAQDRRASAPVPRWQRIRLPSPSDLNGSRSCPGISQYLDRLDGMILVMLALYVMAAIGVLKILEK